MSCSEDQASCSNSLLDSSMLESESTRSVRKRVPTARYLEEDSYNVVKKIYAEMTSSAKKRGRKSTEERERIAATKGGGSVESKWSAYKKKISHLARSVARDQHFVDSYEFDESDFAIKRAKHTPEDELRKANARIVSAKKAIMEQFEALDAEHSSHKRWLQLKKGFDAEDTFDVDDIMCSLCGGPDEEDNDVLFCDRANCLRAYHQMCLDPPLLSLEDINDDDDWFCRQCACMDECLDLVGEVLGHDCDDYIELFPELRPQASNGAGSIIVDDTSESDDADYDPSEPGSEQELEEPGGDRNDDREGNDSQSGNETTKVKYWKHSSDGSESGSVPRHHKKDGSAGSEEDGDGSGSSQDSDDDDSDNENSDEDGYGSDVSSGVSEDELQGLLRDAQEDGLALDVGLSQSEGDGAGQGAPRRNLRSRRAPAPDPLDKSRTPEGAADVGKAVAMVRRGVLTMGVITAFRFRTSSVNSPGRVKKGKHAVGATVITTAPVTAPVLTVSPNKEAVAIDTSASSAVSQVPADTSCYFTDSQGYFGTAPLPGPIVTQALSAPAEDAEGSSSSDAPPPPVSQVAPPSIEEGIWTAKFDDDFVTFFNLETLREYFDLYAEYASKLASETESANQSSSRSRQILTVLEEQGKLDSANVLTHRRAHKPLDYAALSLQMFGDVPDEDEDTSGDEDQSQPQPPAERNIGGLGSSHRGDTSSRKRGRPRKAPIVIDVDVSSDAAGEQSVHSASPRSPRSPGSPGQDPRPSGVSVPGVAGKKRGRPKKVMASQEVCSPTGSAANAGLSSKKRGRPRKAVADRQQGSDRGADTADEQEQKQQHRTGVQGNCLGASTKKRGRPRKAVTHSLQGTDSDPGTADEQEQDEKPEQEHGTREQGGGGVAGSAKKRGRPKKGASADPGTPVVPHASSSVVPSPTVHSQLMHEATARAGSEGEGVEQRRAPDAGTLHIATESAGGRHTQVHGAGAAAGGGAPAKKRGRPRKAQRMEGGAAPLSALVQGNLEESAPTLDSVPSSLVGTLHTTDSTHQQPVTVAPVPHCNVNAEDAQVNAEVKKTVDTIISVIEIEESII